MSVGIRIGEICYNLRTALEYLIYELARLDSGKVQDDTQFPMVDTQQNFNAGKGRWLRGLDPSHIAAIEQLQPYMGCLWTKALRDISNRDKHREFPEIGGQSEAFVYTRLKDTNFDSIDAPTRRLPHPTMGTVDVKVYVTSAVQFADGTPIAQTLEQIKLGVVETLTAFKPEF
ncbi:MAG: hypothetical protein WAV02_11975 [Stellaceae bacterium]